MDLIKKFRNIGSKINQGNKSLDQINPQNCSSHSDQNKLKILSRKQIFPEIMVNSEKITRKMI